MCGWSVDLTVVGRPAGAGTGPTLIGAGVDRSTLIPVGVGVGRIGAGTGRTLIGDGTGPTLIGAGVVRFMPMPVGVGVDRIGAGTGRTLMGAGTGPTLIGAGVVRFMPMPGPVGAGVGRSTAIPAGAGGGLTRIGASIGRSTHSLEVRTSATPVGAAGVIGDRSAQQFRAMMIPIKQMT